MIGHQGHRERVKLLKRGTAPVEGGRARSLHGRKRGHTKLTKGHREEKWDAILKGHKEKGV